MRRSLLVVTAFATVAACERSQTPDDPRVVSIGTHALWLDCRGRGSPTVLLEAGHTEAAETWRPVQDSIAAFTRVCSYDRAGRGRSTSANDSVRTGVDVVADLAAVLDAARETAPLVLVGHSLGGAFVRLFANAHPTRSAGLVLVDAVHEDEFARIDSLLTPAQRDAGKGTRPMSPERFDIEAIFRELARAPVDSLAIPVTVLARGRPLADGEFPPGWSASQRAAREELRQELQRDFARRVHDGRLVVGEKSGHHVHHDEPGLVVGEVRRMVEEWRRRTYR